MLRLASRPEPDQAVFFFNRPGLNLRNERGVWLAGNLYAFALRVIFPIMKEAANRVAFDFAFRQMRAHVRAIGIKRNDAPIFASVERQFSAKKIERFDAPTFERRRAHSPVPTFDNLFGIIKNL